MEELYADAEPYDMSVDLVRIIKPNEGFGYHSWGPLRENENNYDFFLDRKKQTSIRWNGSEV